jgi:hypothetical protein
MATISAPLARIKSELDRYVPSGLVEDACRASGHAWRERKLGPATTVHLFLLQLLARVALAGVRHVADLAVSAQALCKAKARLPRAVLERLVTAVCAGAAVGDDDDGDGQRWRGLRVRVVDGLSCLTRDTAELARKFGKPRNGRGTSAGYPAPKLLASLDLSTGLIPRVIALPWARQEQTCLSRLLRLMGAGDLMLGDRGLVSFAHVALALRAGVHCLLRLAPRATGARPRRGQPPPRQASGAAGPAGALVATAGASEVAERGAVGGVARGPDPAAGRVPPAPAGLSPDVGLGDHDAERARPVPGAGRGRVVRPAVAGRGLLPRHP